MYPGRFFSWGSWDDAVVRAVASYQCSPGWSGPEPWAQVPQRSDPGSLCSWSSSLLGGSFPAVQPLFFSDPRRFRLRAFLIVSTDRQPGTGEPRRRFLGISQRRKKGTKKKAMFNYFSIATCTQIGSASTMHNRPL